MRCNNCGSEIMNGSQYCQVCGSPASQTQQMQQPAPGGMYQQGGYPQQGMYQQPGQQFQNPYNQPYQNVSSEDAGWGLKILSLLIPLAGLILWIVKKDKEPVAAKTCLIWAGIGVLVNIVFGALL